LSSCVRIDSSSEVLILDLTIQIDNIFVLIELLNLRID
jgi:hypothetical protein